MKKVYLIFLLFYTTLIYGQSGTSEFTSTGTFTVPDGVTTILVEMIGAGGHGGYNGTGGGGGGGYTSSNLSVTPGATIDIQIGIPGSGAVLGTTKIDNTFYATGGENGVSVPNPEIGGGGAGGVGFGGNVANFAGGNGGGGYYTYFGGGGGGAAGADANGGVGGNTIAWVGICLTPGGDGGLSGGSPGGNGGKGAGFTDTFCATTDPAGNGNNYGAGGGGGNGNGGGPGNGAGGYCRISWCAVDVTVVSNGTSITANATDVTYQWIDCTTGAIIDGATSQSYSPLATGNYAVIVNDGLCADTSECVFIEIIIEDIQSYYENLVRVSPNPFESTIHIDGLPNQQFQFAIINNLGQTVWSGNQLLDDYTFLADGIYLLHIANEVFEINKMLFKK